MGTQISNNIHRDLKLLITSITGFKPPEEHFRICEKFVLSNIKYHNYLSVNSNQVKKSIEDVKEKFITHAKYNLAKEFESLVDTFLSSFNFDQHPQPDLQWSLLYLLLDLSNTATSSSNTDYCAKNLSLSAQREKTFSLAIPEKNEIDEIDWSQYLQEGLEEFFSDFREADSSDSELTESEDDNDQDRKINIKEVVYEKNKPILNVIEPIIPLRSTSNFLEKFTKLVESQKWLDKNIENDWWNSAVALKSECMVISQVPQANFCKIYDQQVLNHYHSVTGLITEYQACREILWMFHIPTDMTVFEKKSHVFCVRPNISIPSLTSTAFSSICSNFCDAFSIIENLYSFEENLNHLYKTQNAELYPPLTYDTYSEAIKQYVNRIKREIVKIESRAIEKNDATTLLTLFRDLKESQKNLEMLYEVHKSMNFEQFESAPNWEKAGRLISNLYRELENSGSCKRTNFCASLYVASLRVYLNIIDTWLSEGRLEDYRNEFLIHKVPSDAENEPKMTSFVTRRSSEDLNLDPILEKLLKKVEEMGTSIELLVALNRISDMWQLNPEQYSLRIPLNDEFITQVLIELSEYSSLPISVDETDSKLESPKSPKLSTGLDDNIKQQISRINNPFLMKAFSDFLPPMDISTGPMVNTATTNSVVMDVAHDTVDVADNSAGVVDNIVNIKSNEKKKPVIINDWGIKIFDRFEQISPFILPISRVLENVLEKILDQRYSCASKLVKDILINEYKLEKHLKLMRSIYMMERGHIMEKFYNQMFFEIENKLSQLDPDYLTYILDEVLCDEWRESNSNNRWSITLSNNVTCEVLQAIDQTTLNYAVDWPINMILTDQVLAKYNEIFRFQLKLKWALWSLNNLRFVDLEGSNSDEMKDLFYHFYVRRLECLRFWLLHAIGSIHTYLSGQVLESLGMIFEKSLTEANDLDNIIQLHNNYLTKVYEHCLQTCQFKDIISTINSLLSMCIDVKDRWERGVKQLIPTDLDLMESNYTKYHTYLALALHNAVQHKEAHYYESNPLQYFLLIKDLFSEIAYQSFPPSGIHFPIYPAHLIQAEKQNFFYQKKYNKQ